MISFLQSKIDVKTYRVENINVCDIELSDETFKISSDNDIATLEASIKSIGMINMPLVKRVIENQLKDKYKYVVISGFKRIQAIKSIGITQILVVVIESDDKLCSCLAIADNAFQRPLNIIEQMRGIRLLKSFISADQEIIENSPQIFNFKINANLINMFSDIAQMPESIHRLIQNDRLAVNCAVKFKQYGYDNDLIDLFAKLFSKIKTSLSKQKEIITNIHEIAARDSLSIIDLIESNELRQILDNSENDENRKGNLIRSLLFERRYPNLSKAKKEFNNTLRALALKNDIKLEPSPDFEEKDCTVTFKFSNIKELEEKIENLKEVSKNPLIQKIIQ